MLRSNFLLALLLAEHFLAFFARLQMLCLQRAAWMQALPHYSVYEPRVRHYGQGRAQLVLALLRISPSLESVLTHFLQGRVRLNAPAGSPETGRSVPQASLANGCLHASFPVKVLKWKLRNIISDRQQV